MEISIYSTIDFSKARNLLTERQKNIRAFNPIVPEGGCISLLELNPKQYISIHWFFVNQKTGKITPTTAESSDGMHYVAIPEGLRLGTYTLKIETRHLVGDVVVKETTISNPFEYVEASSDIVTIVSSNADNNLVGTLRKNAVIIQPIYTNPPSGGDIPEPASRTTARLMKTGQITSYRTGDDGDIEAGREVDFFTLAENNPFGNTNRFTDELGGQGYANNIVIDWSTYDGSTVLGIYRIYLDEATWEQLIDNCLALSVGTFTTGWRMWNLNECVNFINAETTFNYAPLNIASFGGYCATSTGKGNYAQKVMPVAFGFSLGAIQKVSTSKAMAVRDFTVTGTTLT